MAVRGWTPLIMSKFTALFRWLNTLCVHVQPPEATVASPAMGHFGTCPLRLPNLRANYPSIV